jgi:hypothetical protein
MRQGNGTELLGVNDPRGTSIGLIHVTPDDDRKSVLAAIITQEKLGRKQVAVVLPAQNKAFQRAVDFDDLKSMRRRLHTQIVFIAPSGSGPAEFARQRRFPVYSSLESYTRALREDPGMEDQAENQKVRLFGGTHRGAPTTPTANGTTPPDSGQEQDTPASEDKVRRRSSVAPFLAGAAAGGAAALAADDIANAHTIPGPGVSQETTSPLQSEDRTGPMPGAAPDDEEDDALPPPAAAAGAGAAASAAGAAAATQAGKGAGANGTANTESAGGPGIIELPVQQRKTAPLNPGQQPASKTGPTRKRNTGKTAGAVAAGTAAGAAAAGLGMAAASQAPTRSTGAGGGPPTRGAGGGGGGGGGPRRSNRSGWLLGLILLLIVALLIGGGMALAHPKILDPITSALPKVAPPATVTITPNSTTVQDTYVVTGVTGTPNTAQRQVSARTLTGSAASQPITVNATGHNQTVGARAVGRLTFINGSTSPFTVAAGTAIPTSAGVSMITDAPANIPAANPGVSFGSVTVSAHAASVGTRGNIGAGTINGTCCASGNFIVVKNNQAFTGGQDPKNYNFVQQGDVNSAISGVQSSLVQQANRSVTAQLHTGEQLAGAEHCTPEVTPSGPIGDRGENVASITVNVTVNCSGTAYDQQGVQALVTGLLQTKAKSDPGAGYALVGNVVTQTSVQSVNDGTVSLLVNAKGLWVYQISKALEQQWAKQIAGKSVSAATSLLQSQPGIHSVTIQASGSTLPTEPTQIAFTVQNIQGLQGSSTPPVGSPTVTAPQFASPQSVPGNG